MLDVDGLKLERGDKVAITYSKWGKARPGLGVIIGFTKCQAKVEMGNTWIYRQPRYIVKITEAFYGERG